MVLRTEIEFSGHNLEQQNTVQLICGMRYARTRIACSSTNLATMTTVIRDKIYLLLIVSTPSGHFQSHPWPRRLDKSPKLKPLYSRYSQWLQRRNLWREKIAKTDQTAVMVQHFPRQQVGQIEAHNSEAGEAVMQRVAQPRVRLFPTLCLPLQRRLKRQLSQFRSKQ